MGKKVVQLIPLFLFTSGLIAASAALEIVSYLIGGTIGLVALHLISFGIFYYLQKHSCMNPN